MVNQAPLSDGEINTLFIANDPPAKNTFELALVLGGTVSAGAFTAGAMDFLIEALDAWTALRDKNDAAAPRHQTVLKVITGTSGGGVNTAIAARALAYDFPHVVRATPNPEHGTGNPFYDVWVNRLTLAGFLDTRDIDRKQWVSLLNGAPIDEGAAVIAGYSSPNGRPRSYLADPLWVTPIEGQDIVEIGDHVMVQMGDESRIKMITLTADRHDPDLGLVSARHLAGERLLGASEDEEIEFEVDGRNVRWMVVKIEKAKLDKAA